jgi:hypothetical protein
MPERLDEEELADRRAGRNSVYQLAALTVDAPLAVADSSAEHKDAALRGEPAASERRFAKRKPRRGEAGAFARTSEGEKLDRPGNLLQHHPIIVQVDEFSGPDRAFTPWRPAGGSVGCRKRLAVGPASAPRPSRTLAALRVGRRARPDPAIRFRLRLGRAQLCWFRRNPPAATQPAGFAVSAHAGMMRGHHRADCASRNCN